LFYISRGNQIIERLGRFLLVESVLRYQRSHGEQVLAQHAFFGVQDGAVVCGNGNRDEDQHHADYDHQFDQGEASTVFSSIRHYQLLYSVPSKPLPCDLVKTSKTFCPPHESESGSSCIERRPHSVLPVMGSTGTRRRKRTFLPPTSTPLT